MNATAERGARFHPTIGSVIPRGFTTNHPWAETTMLRYCISVCQWPRMRVTLPLLCYHSLCIFQSSLPSLASAPFSLLPRVFFLLRGCVWCNFPRTSQAWWLYGWVVHAPHLSLLIRTHLPTNPGESFNSGPASRSWFSGLVNSKYGIGFDGS